MLVNLPDDLLLDIIQYTDVRDLLNLRKTCRALHTFGGNDYVWHRIVAELPVPIDLPWHTHPTSLHGEELQRLAVKAIRLDENWRHPQTRVRGLRSLIDDKSGQYVDQMQFLPGGKWLWTAQRILKRDSWCTRMSLWSVEDANNTCRVWSTEISGIYRSCTVVTSRDGETATLVVGVCEHRDVIEVHTISLREAAKIRCGIYPGYPTTLPAKPKQLQIRPHPRAPHLRPIIHEIATHGDLLIVTIFALDTGGGAGSLQVLLMNPETGIAKWVEPSLVQAFPFLWVRVWGEFLFLLGEVGEDFAVHVYRVPQPFPPSPRRTPSPCVGTTPEDPNHDEYSYISLGPRLARFTGRTPMAVPGHHIAQVSPPSSTSGLSAIMFYHSVEPHCAQLLRFAFNVTTDTVSLSGRSSKDFPIGNESSAQLAQVGAMGIRAVWLEHDWETQLNRVMKLAYDPATDVAKVGMLLPPDPELPFTPNMCHSLAFDEITGRLCLGMYDGNVYMLDFV
ncbi:hypothetical protein C8Q80DRAFT_645405 [Daedaleopsis nitida]|nr:hypothetical protein C8Q80DRAFT_645405 [Daedaleopsis nitida]